MSVLVEPQGTLYRVTINRPDRANALNSETISALRVAIESAQEHPEARVIILTGAGERSFVSGADIQELAALNVATGEAFIRNLHESLHAIRTQPLPVIAAVNGFALGAGLELVMACDIAIAVEHAMFGMPEVKIGVPSVIECALMPSVIGLMRTRELVLIGDNIDAERAERIGLVNQVVPAHSLANAVEQVAERLIGNGPRALALQKELVNRWLNLPMDEAIEAGIKNFATAFATDEPQAAISEFWNRRKSS